MNPTVVHNNEHIFFVMFIKDILTAFMHLTIWYAVVLFLRSFGLEDSKVSPFLFLPLGFWNSSSSFSISARFNGSTLEKLMVPNGEMQPTIVTSDINLNSSRVAFFGPCATSHHLSMKPSLIDKTTILLKVNTHFFPFAYYFLTKKKRSFSISLSVVFRSLLQREMTPLCQVS